MYFIQFKKKMKTVYCKYYNYNMEFGNNFEKYKSVS